METVAAKKSYCFTRFTMTALANAATFFLAIGYIELMQDGTEGSSRTLAKINFPR